MSFAANVQSVFCSNAQQPRDIAGRCLKCNAVGLAEPEMKKGDPLGSPLFWRCKPVDR
jgi:hypothetical protein